MTTAILAIILFALMIFPHELGHFIAAKCMGVKVNEFAFGMGPALWKKQGKETLYSIRLFPIGGYCAMEGEDGQEDEEQKAEPNEVNDRAFNQKKPWQKLIILAAGSFMNLVTAVVIMTVVLGITGFTTTTIGEVTEGGPAAQAGILVGDEIIAIDETAVESWNDVVSYVIEKDETIEITVLRDGEEMTIPVVPEYQETLDDAGNVIDQRYIVGIVTKITHNPLMAISGGVQSTWNIGVTMVDSLKMLFTGEAGMDDLAGPVGMVQMVNETRTLGFWYFGFLAALICVNLAMVNMLPLPALDGGRIIFVLISMITGKGISERVEGTIHLIGMILFLILFVYVTQNDIMRIFFN